MKFITYACSLHDLAQIKDINHTEVIINHPDLSRICFHKNSLELMNEAKKLGLRVILEFDILMTEGQFDSTMDIFHSIPNDLYDVIRVQDVGVLEYILDKSSKPIQFIAETGNRNLLGLKKWVSYIGQRLDRLVLSIELSSKTILEYRKELGCPLELLCLGRILLFYTPRNLLSPLKSNEQIVSSDFIKALGESEESPHKGFPLVENRHGTFMFHIKDLFLLDKIEDLKQLDLDFLRIDIRHLDFDRYRKYFSNPIADDFNELKSEYEVDKTRGYFHINKSDVLFKKLKNYRIQRKDESYIGEVVEIVKSDYMAIQLKSNLDLNLGQKLKFITPEGKEQSCFVHTLKNSSYADQEVVHKGHLALINYFGGIWPKSQVYLAE